MTGLSLVTQIATRHGVYYTHDAEGDSDPRIDVLGLHGRLDAIASVLAEISGYEVSETPPDPDTEGYVVTNDPANIALWRTLPKDHASRYLREIWV